MDFLDTFIFLSVKVAYLALFIFVFLRIRRLRSDTLQRDESKTTQRRDEKDAKNDSKNDVLVGVKCQKHKSPKNGQKPKYSKRHHHSNGDRKRSIRAASELDELLAMNLNGIQDMDFNSNGEYFGSGTEESILKRHNPKHRNSSTSDASSSTSDDVNSVGSDLSDTYEFVKINKKNVRIRQNRKQRRLQQQQKQQQEHQQQSSRTQQIHKKQCGNLPKSPNNAHNLEKSNKAQNSKAIHFKTAAEENRKPLQSDKDSRSKNQSVGKNLNSSVSPFSSPTSSPKSKRFSKIRHMIESPFALIEVLSEYQIVNYLQKYLLDERKLRGFGYPVESMIYEGCIEIYKSVPRFFKSQDSGVRYYDSRFINSNDGLSRMSPSARKLSSEDSGKGSGTSTPQSYSATPNDSDYSEEEVTSDSIYSRIVKKTCVRCRKPFKVTTDGEFITREQCNYHWGKQETGEFIDAKGKSVPVTFYSCCKKISTEPCSQNHVHVWTDVINGLNGPYTDFVRTERHQQNVNSSDYEPKIYALDCEMSYTAFGMEVTKVTIVAYDGQPVYETIIYPKAEVGDYNTRFSGVSEKDFQPGNDARTLEAVQADILQLVDANDILIGHALENDLKSLKIVHKRIVDTSIVFPHPHGFPFRRGLKSIVLAELGREIQTEGSGHCSLEDSRACLELMLLKVRDELNESKKKTGKLPVMPGTHGRQHKTTVP